MGQRIQNPSRRAHGWSGIFHSPPHDLDAGNAQRRVRVSGMHVFALQESTDVRTDYVQRNCAVLVLNWAGDILHSPGYEMLDL
ncbi:hypothetical protein AOLI_G00259160 [Acnodon oligacanthus]